jgi:hypothetical protein
MTDQFGAILEQARKLSTLEQLRLVESILPEVESALSAGEASPRRQWKGIYRNTGPVPTEEDITEMRREAWPQP